MPNPYFRFKQFTIWQDCCAMKVGTDGVLLGAWAPIPPARRILDIGTGTGLVALMLAQRSPETTQITAIELDSAAAQQAQENVSRSPWADRIQVLQGDFLSHSWQTTFDLIVSNPPYFEHALPCPDAQRNQARHTSTLNYERLIQQSATLLSPFGLLALIIPAEQTDKVIGLAQESKLHLHRQLHILTRPGKSPKRTLLSFSPQLNQPQIAHLLIETTHHAYTQEYIDLTAPFYLHL